MDGPAVVRFGRVWLVGIITTLPVGRVRCLLLLSQIGTCLLIISPAPVRQHPTSIRSRSWRRIVYLPFFTHSRRSFQWAHNRCRGPFIVLRMGSPREDRLSLTEHLELLLLQGTPAIDRYRHGGSGCCCLSASNVCGIAETRWALFVRVVAAPFNHHLSVGGASARSIASGGHNGTAGHLRSYERMPLRERRRYWLAESGIIQIPPSGLHYSVRGGGAQQLFDDKASRHPVRLDQSVVGGLGLRLDNWLRCG